MKHRIKDCVWYITFRYFVSFNLKHNLTGIVVSGTFSYETKHKIKDHTKNFCLNTNRSLRGQIIYLTFKFLIMISHCRTANMDVFTVQTGPGPRARPPSAPTTARWTPPTAATTGTNGGVSRQPSGSEASPPPAYTKLDHQVTNSYTGIILLILISLN